MLIAAALASYLLVSADRFNLKCMGTKSIDGGPRTSWSSNFIIDLQDRLWSVLPSKSAPFRVSDITNQSIRLDMSEDEHEFRMSAKLERYSGAITVLVFDGKRIAEMLGHCEPKPFTSLSAPHF